MNTEHTDGSFGPDGPGTIMSFRQLYITLQRYTLTHISEMLSKEKVRQFSFLAALGVTNRHCYKYGQYGRFNLDLSCFEFNLV